jgi:hypothetical protein
MANINHALICTAQSNQKHCHMLGTILLVFLIISLIGALPRWKYSSQWGYAPSGGLGLIFIVVLILWLIGKI